MKNIKVIKRDYKKMLKDIIYDNSYLCECIYDKYGIFEDFTFYKNLVKNENNILDDYEIIDKKLDYDIFCDEFKFFDEDAKLRFENGIKIQENKYFK